MSTSHLHRYEHRTDEHGGFYTCTECGFSIPEWMAPGARRAGADFTPEAAARLDEAEADDDRAVRDAPEGGAA